MKAWAHTFLGRADDEGQPIAQVRGSTCALTQVIQRHAFSTWKSTFGCGRAQLTFREFLSKQTMQPHEKLVWELLGSISRPPALPSDILLVFIKHVLCARSFPHSS